MATKTRRVWAGAVGFLLAISPWSAAVFADEPTRVTTALAVELEAGSGQALTVSADRTKQPMKQMALGVYLGDIPSYAKLTSCTFRLVTASAVAKTQYNGVNLQLFDAAQDAKTAKSIASSTVGAGAAAGTVVEFKTDGLCQTLQEARDSLAAAAPGTVPAGEYLSVSPSSLTVSPYTPRPWCFYPSIEEGFLKAECERSPDVRAISTIGPVDRCVPFSIALALDGSLRCALFPVFVRSISTASFRVQTTISLAEVSFWGRESVEPKLVPRLLLTYDLPNSWPGRADWSQPRRDAQQSGLSAWKMYNDNRAYTPANFAVRTLGDATFTNVSPPLLLYDRQLVAVSGANVHFMNADGKVVRTISLPIAPKRLGISQHGWLYATGENKIIMRRLQGELQFTIDIGGEETVLNPPTIGDDGSLYVVTSKFVYRYPPPPVPTTLTNVPLWRHATVSESSKNNDVSRVALSADGRTAYFVDKQIKAMIALDAETGKERWKREGIEISRGDQDEMPTPVVAHSAVFVADHAPVGNQIYVVNAANGTLLDKICCGKVSAPIAGPDQTVDYFFSDQLWQWDLSKSESRDGRGTLANGSCQKLETDLLRGDESGNIYALDRKHEVLAFLPAKGGTCVQLRGTADAKLDIESLVVAPDGSMFGYSSAQKLVRVTPVAPGQLALSNQILKLNQDRTELVENNYTTFRAREVVTSPNLSLPANTNINIAAEKRIAFANGFSIRPGARLRAWVGDSPDYPVQPVSVTRKADESAGPEGYAFCAAESGTCSFSGTKNVAYGANGKFAYKTATNGIACNNATFGDPIVGTVKGCFMK